MNRFPLILSLSIGFVSLSQEILWVRVFGFVNQGLPQAFAAVLTLYLFGIAVGANIGKVVCRRYSALYPIAGLVLIGAGLFDVLAPFIYSQVAGHDLGLPILALLIVLTALNKSILFPIVHHLGTEGLQGTVGKNVSQVYFMNVVGSALGPLVTGFILLDYLSVHASMIALGIVTVFLGLICLLPDRKSLMALAGTGLVAVVVVAVSIRLVGTDYDRLVRKSVQATTCEKIEHVVENKHGIIHVCPSNRGDVIFGGNVYDGRMSKNPIDDSNGLDRLLLVSAIHQQPSRVLVIGLSGAAWLTVLTNMPGVEQIEVVEINSGYLEVIRHYPDMQAAIDDPRVRIHIDDGRRWLKNNPLQKFDLILMNTTFSWRAYSTNLLSREFLTEVRSHLEEGGLVAYNGTGSPDAFLHRDPGLSRGTSVQLVYLCG